MAMMFSPPPRAVQRQLLSAEPIFDNNIDTDMEAAHNAALPQPDTACSASPSNGFFEELSTGTENASPCPALVDEGNNDGIRVAARFRPVDTAEDNLGAEKLCVAFGNNGKSCCITTKGATGTNDNSFVYNHVFEPGATQEDVYLAMAQPVVKGIVNGINGTIFAYGQTGSGKTHTMLGPDDGDIEVDMSEVGIIPRVLQDLLKHVNASMEAMTLHAVYVEIYLEKFIDLLASRHEGSFKPKTPDLHEAEELPIFSLADAMLVMRKGNKNRHTAGTKMNTHSSRSHAIFIVKVRKHGRRFAQLCLVDLAGSEKSKETGATGQQLEEANNINTSLLALEKVVHSLAHKKKVASFRESKLTWLLQKSLEDGAKTSILVAASPHEHNAQATLKALQFGQKASTVRAEVRRHVVEDPSVVKQKLQHAEDDLSQLRDECRRLQAQRAAFQAVEMIPTVSHALETDDRADGGMLDSLTAKRLYVWDLLPLLICPLTNAIMRDPVCAGDGHSYERRAMQKYISNSRCFPLSPVTNQQLTTRQLVPNLMVKQLISNHLPELPPLEMWLPQFIRLHVWHVRQILTYLDARSLAHCEAAWPSFLAAANSSRVWSVLLLHDFGSEIAEAEGVADETCVAARSRYSKLALQQVLALGAFVAQGTNGPSRGLVLRAGPDRAA